MHETRLPMVYYFPRDDVRMDLLERTEHLTYCPFKGNASYWTVKVGDKTSENTAWSYEAPFDEAEMVRDYVAFFWGPGWMPGSPTMSRCTLPIGIPSRRPTTRSCPGWCTRRGRRPPPRIWSSSSPRPWLPEGMPIFRMRLMIQTLNSAAIRPCLRLAADRGRGRGIQATHAGRQSARSSATARSPW